VAYLESEEASIGDVWVADFPGGAARRVTFDRTQVRGLCWQGEDGLLVASYRERGRSGIWRVDLATGRMERWTEATSESRTPAYAEGAGLVVWSRHVGNIHVWRRGGDWKGPGEAWIRATGLNTSPQFSPDGKRVALRSNRSGRSEIWVVEVETGAARRLTGFNGPVTGSPRWSPDGKRVAFDSRVHGKADIFVVDVDGGRLERVTTAESNEVVPGWSADGKSLYFASDRGGGWGLWRRVLETGVEERVRAGAFAGFEIGDFVYFTGGPERGGLYRMPKGGGEAEAVVAGLRPSMWANWAVTAEGLVWVEELGDGTMRLRRRTGAGVEEDLGDAGAVVRWDGGLAVSPDGRTLLLARLSGGDADLYVAEAR
jgi:Tol biopolymer transport system component